MDGKEDLIHYSPLFTHVNREDLDFRAPFEPDGFRYYTGPCADCGENCILVANESAKVTEVICGYCRQIRSGWDPRDDGLKLREGKPLPLRMRNKDNA